MIGFSSFLISMPHFPEIFDCSEESAFASTRLFFYLLTYQNLHILLRNSRIEIWNWVNHVVKRSSQKLSNVFEINKCENILGIERRGKHIFGSIRHLTWNSCGSERAQFRSQSAVWIANAFSCDRIR